VARLTLISSLAAGQQHRLPTTDDGSRWRDGGDRHDAADHEPGGVAHRPATRPHGPAVRLVRGPAPLAGRTDLPFADGSADYFDLFVPGAPWETAAEHVDAYKVAASWLDNYATDEQVRAVVASTAARGQALALEIGPLSPQDGCGSGEGFDSALDPLPAGRAGRRQLRHRRLRRTVRLRPRVHLRLAGRARRLVAADWVRTVRARYPDILIGDIEPLWREIDPGELGGWMDAYREAAGAPFDFFQLDADWTLDDWPERAIGAIAEARSRGIPAGLIYDGGEASSDEEWNANARARIDAFEGRLAGPPDHLIFQSWMDHPDLALPDTDPSTFTGLMRQYFAPRATLTVDGVDEARPGTLTVSGTLRASGTGAPIPGATIRLGAMPSDGAYQVLTLEGRVPAGTTSAVIGLRANTEEAGPGPVHVSVYEVGYVEEHDRRNLVPEPRFMRGPWGYAGTASGCCASTPSRTRT